MSEAATNAMSILRSTDQADWTIIPLIFFACYVYSVEIEKKNWDFVLFAIGAMMMWFWVEIANALVLHFTGYSSPWICSTKTNFMIFVGFNIEILLAYFAVGILMYLKVLPRDRRQKIAGLPNRIVFPIGGAVFCFLTELFMTEFEILIWDYSWWVYCVLPGYVIIFFMITIGYDYMSVKLTLRQKGLVVGYLVAATTALYGVLAVALRWI